MIDPDFGTCLSCDGDLTPDFAMVSGFSVIEQACVRRLSTPRGSLGDDPNYGTDLRDLISAGADSRTLATVPALVRNELLKDQRITGVSTTYAFANAILKLQLEIMTGQGSFSLVLGVSAVSVAVLQNGTV